MQTKSLSENRFPEGGQAQFAPKTSQIEPDPGGSRIGFKQLRPSVVLQIAAAAIPLVTITSFARAITIDTVPVGNAGNAPDTRYDATGFGSVGYHYRIGKYEVTAGQYTEFLNAVAQDDPNELYNIAMGIPINTQGANIQKSGLPRTTATAWPPTGLTGR